MHPARPAIQPGPRTPGPWGNQTAWGKPHAVTLFLPTLDHCPPPRHPGVVHAQPSANATATGDTVKLTEWTVPWEKTRPRDPSVDATGRIWFVGQEGNYVARLDPKSGVFARIELD